MAPELVIAEAPFKSYPGGVIVLPCVEWLGAARGTLTTEADARSAYGTVVRDSQVVTESIFDRELAAQLDALNEADDTFVIDLADLPIEVDFRYNVFLSLLIEGDWDPTNDDTTRGAHQERFEAACQLRWWNGTLSTLAQSQPPQFKPRGLDSYRVVRVGITPTLTGSEVMTWRAFSQSGTTCEFLLDQIYLVPSTTTSVDEWDSSDWEEIPGNWSTSGLGGIGDGFVDGADGGDDFGKFTWHPNVDDAPIGSSGGDGGGDYQKDDSEYMIRLQPDDIFLWNNITESEAAAHLYGIHGPFYVPTQQWVNDDFSRTVGDNDFTGADNHFALQTWGDTPEGFAWVQDAATGPTGLPGVRTGRVAWVSGTEAGLEIRGNGTTQSILVHLRPDGGESGPNVGARVSADNLTFAGEFRTEDVGGGASAKTLTIRNLALSLGQDQVYEIHVNLSAGTWQVRNANLAAIGGGPHTLPAEPVGFRLEIRRYIIRARVWDASGAEPSTWDVEEFRPMNVTGVTTAYPYSDNLATAILEVDRHSLAFRFQATSVPTAYTRVLVDNVTIDHDAGGPNESAWVSVEKPEGNEVGRIELPAGCQHLVYWGTRDWTALDGGFPYLDFSAKAWNDAGAAELQRSECPWWWLRSVHGGIVSMNWNSATSRDVTRVHA